MKLALGFLLLGFLVGDMAGLTSESVVSKLIALLFALFGGSIVLLYKKFSVDERGQVGVLIGAISVGTLLGVHVGIVTTQYRLLSPPKPKVIVAALGQTAPANQNPSPAPNPLPVVAIVPNESKNHPHPHPPACVITPTAPPPVQEKPDCTADLTYLRSKVVPGADLIDGQLQQHLIGLEEAYRELRELVHTEKP